MRRCLSVVILTSIILTGCGSSKSDVEPVQDVQEPVVYTLKSTDDIVVNDNVEEPEVIPDAVQSELTDDTTIIVEEQSEETPVDLASSTEPDLDNNVEDINEFDYDQVIRNINIPSNMVMTVDLGVPGMGLIMGEAGDYKCIGTQNCYMWESANGTFYYDNGKVKSVEVEGRSVMFGESTGDDDDDDGMSMNISTDIDIVSKEDAETLIDNLKSSEDVSYNGVSDYAGHSCYELTFTDVDEDGEVTNSSMFIDASDYALRGFKVSVEEFSIGATIYDYFEMLSEDEANVSGSISDEDAAEATEGNIMGSVMMLMFGALASEGME